MIVFAVLMDRSGVTNDTGAITVINKPDHQLPLFMFRFTPNRSIEALANLHTPGASTAAMLVMWLGHFVTPTL